MARMMGKRTTVTNFTSNKALDVLTILERNVDRHATKENRYAPTVVSTVPMKGSVSERPAR
jgi:hypothetical protein